MAFLVNCQREELKLPPETVQGDGRTGWPTESELLPDFSLKYQVLLYPRAIAIQTMTGMPTADYQPISSPRYQVFESNTAHCRPRGSVL